MTLEYEFPTKYLGRNEKLEEEYYDTETYEFEHETTEEDVKDYLRNNVTIGELLDEHTLSVVIYEIFEFLNLDELEEYEDFIEFMHDKYEDAARKVFYNEVRK